MMEISIQPYPHSIHVPPPTQLWDLASRIAEKAHVLLDHVGFRSNCGAEEYYLRWVLNRRRAQFESPHGQLFVLCFQ